MSASKIEWTEFTWNPTRGCSHASPGCANCYAERISARFSGPDQPFHLYAERNPKPHFTGKVGLAEDMLDAPLRRRKPTTYFVNSMSDLFHEKLPDEAIDRVFAVMALCPQHTFQVLTKRAMRMRAWVWSRGVWSRGSHRDPHNIGYWTAQLSGEDRDHFITWPLPNVWLGVSVEDRVRKDRIEELRKIPASIRFLSLEPLLEDLGALDLTGIHWIIVGGESGPDARPMDIAWVRTIVGQCRDAGVACFVKQLGAKPYSGESLHLKIHKASCDGRLYLKLKDSKGGSIEEWPADLRIREMPHAQIREVSRG